MDIFKFINPNNPMKMEYGSIINGLKTKLWVERYDKPGEFKFTADASSGIKDILPPGCFISHTDSDVIMIVENHEIATEKGKQSVITTTGSTFDSFFKHRLVGNMLKTFPNTVWTYDYFVLENAPETQVRDMINTHIDLPYVTTIALPRVGTPDRPYRHVPRGELASRVQSFLEADGMGIRILRPSPVRDWGIFFPADHTGLAVHQGWDKTAEVAFSYAAGEVESADYFWSEKKKKNYAFVSGRWWQVLVRPTEIGYDRRMIYVDASDIDENYQEVPQGGQGIAVLDAMIERGKDVLAAHNDVAITKADISQEGTRWIYRQDYEIGDLVTVLGEYNESVTMRVNEYVEIEDENGTKEYPTLIIP